MVDSILRCKVDGYRAFDHGDFTRHMSTHWEEVHVEMRQVSTCDLPATESSTVSTQDEQAREAVAMAMTDMFGDGKEIV